jgi:nitroreductase
MVLIIIFTDVLIIVIDMELLNRHVTIRNFLDTPIDPGILSAILYSGTRASTTGNMQTYSLIVTQEEEAKKAAGTFAFQSASCNKCTCIDYICC